MTATSCNRIMAKVINVKIDVKKIDKAKLYAGEKGTYLDAVMFVNDEADQYGNWGMVVQSVTKEEKEKGIKGAILGNVKTKERLYTVSELKSLVADTTGNTNVVDYPADDLPF